MKDKALLKEVVFHMLFVYPAIFHHENDTYWVEFPDLSGCFSYGTDISDALKAAQEALGAYLITLLEEGKEIAAPSDIVSYHAEDGFVSLVSCDLDQYKNTKAVKKTLTIPSWLNDRAVSMGINFSQVLQEALLAKLMK
ncbi:MAG: type II toxin-antitoxin system HicB family antitoxin [Eubacteriales bacterium]|nr:type II toxin-antitoxin system HicB family antitoxin [Eubacteriales bacterium]